MNNLGLTVSGKKDDLVGRIGSYYRTEIPSQDDGSPELIDNLDSVESDDIPAAPELDEEEAIPDPEPEPELEPEPDPEVEEVAEEVVEEATGTEMPIAEVAEEVVEEAAEESESEKS